MRRGFTMVELIFVIVILGILAAVAIPKLAATRTDAEVSKSLTEISTAISDFGAYYTSKGKFSTKLDDMTKVAFGTTTDIAFGTQFAYETKNVSGTTKCVGFTVYEDGNVTVAKMDEGQQVSGTPCHIIQKSASFKKFEGNQSFGGSNVEY